MGTRVRVYHGYYGCETGCCGHWIEVDGEERFDFAHPGSQEDKREFAIDFAKEMVKGHWPQCYDTIDWDSIEIEDIRDE